MKKLIRWFKSIRIEWADSCDCKEILEEMIEKRIKAIDLLLNGLTFDEKNIGHAFTQKSLIARKLELTQLLKELP